MAQFIELTDVDGYGNPTTKRLVNVNWIYDVHPSQDGNQSVIRFSPVSISEERIHGITVVENYETIRVLLHDIIHC